MATATVLPAVAVTPRAGTPTAGTPSAGTPTAPWSLRHMFGRRCRSWRPRTGTTHPQGHLPGGCRVCWRPCLHRVDSGETRCVDCAWALAQHADPRVRLALADGTGVPLDVLELLATDPDPLVADRAAGMAAFRGAGTAAVATAGGR